jgi:DNA (cytosine-5)-methyltransferase 1
VTYTVLDLGCGAGGVAEGWRRAGFRVIGIDIVPQPRFFRKIQRGDEFYQADLMDVLRALERDRFWASEHWDEGEHGAFGTDDIDIVSLSAPCQRWSRMSSARPGIRAQYPDLITPSRPLLRAIGLPYIIENVPGAPLENWTELCCWQFGREMYRHRRFEPGNGLTLVAPPHRPHVTPASKAGHWVPGTFFSMAGHVAPMWKAREVMGIEWMNREEMAEAVPPYMIEYLAYQVRAQLLLAVA